MNIQAEKLRLIEWISKVDDSDIITMLKQIKDNISDESKDEMNLSKEEIAGIERGLKDIEEGRIHSHESVMKKYEKYL